jgi:hypothetical protein
VRLEARAELIGALEAAEKKPKLKAEHLFTDVYDRLPKHLGAPPSLNFENIYKYILSSLRIPCLHVVVCLMHL